MHDPGVVIVGAGHAGGRCALALRQSGYAGSITLVGDEPYLPYERPPLSKECLTSDGDMASACPVLASAAQWADLAIQHLPGVRVAQLDRSARTVHTSQGAALTYDALVLAMGSRPRPWTVEGVSPSAVHTVRTLDDALRLKNALRQARRLVVIGGGFIGLEVAASASRLGLAVALVEPQPRLLARALSPGASEAVRQLHAGCGINIHLGRSVVAARQTAGEDVVLLDDDTELAYDLIVTGIGSLPATELAGAAGLALCPDTRGVVVDGDCRTSDPHVYAIGDIASAVQGPQKRALRLESWDNAEAQGGIAARAIAARDGDDGGVTREPSPSSSAVPWFWTDQHGLNLQMLGTWQGADRTVQRGDLATRGVLFHLQGGRLVGAELFNSARDRRLVKGWIHEATAVDAAILADSGIPLARAVHAVPATSSPKES